jgi:hypothetical protein
MYINIYTDMHIYMYIYICIGLSEARESFQELTETLHVTQENFKAAEADWKAAEVYT